MDGVLRIGAIRRGTGRLPASADNKRGRELGSSPDEASEVVEAGRLHAVPARVEAGTEQAGRSRGVEEETACVRWRREAGIVTLGQIQLRNEAVGKPRYIEDVIADGVSCRIVPGECNQCMDPISGLRNRHYIECVITVLTFSVGESCVRRGPESVNTPDVEVGNRNILSDESINLRCFPIFDHRLDKYSHGGDVVALAGERWP